MTAATISNWQFETLNDASPQVLTAIEEVTSISGLGKLNELVEVTNFDSPAGTKEFIAGLADGSEMTVEANYIAGTNQQSVVRGAVDAGNTRQCRLRYTGSSPEETFTFSGVMLGWEIGPSPTEANSITFTIKISGDIT